jgi:hypothetical protein
MIAKGRPILAASSSTVAVWTRDRKASGYRAIIVRQQRRRFRTHFHQVSNRVWFFKVVAR